MESASQSSKLNSGAGMSRPPMAEPDRETCSTTVLLDSTLADTILLEALANLRYARS